MALLLLDCPVSREREQGAYGDYLCTVYCVRVPRPPYAFHWPRGTTVRECRTCGLFLFGIRLRQRRTMWNSGGTAHDQGYRQGLTRFIWVQTLRYVDLRPLILQWVVSAWILEGVDDSALRPWNWKLELELEDWQETRRGFCSPNYNS